MYRKKNREKQEEEDKISLEALVPQNYILIGKEKAPKLYIFLLIEGTQSKKPVSMKRALSTV